MARLDAGADGVADVEGEGDASERQPYEDEPDDSFAAADRARSAAAAGKAAAIASSKAGSYVGSAAGRGTGPGGFPPARARQLMYRQLMC